MRRNLINLKCIYKKSVHVDIGYFYLFMWNKLASSELEEREWKYITLTCFPLSEFNTHNTTRNRKCDSNSSYLKYVRYGGILLLPTCKINYVNMQHHYFNMRLIFMSTCTIIMLTCTLSIFVKNYFFLPVNFLTNAIIWYYTCNMQHVMFTCDLFMSTWNIIMSTCDLFMSTCNIFMFTCDLFMSPSNIIMFTCKIFMCYTCKC